MVPLAREPRVGVEDGAAALVLGPVGGRVLEPGPQVARPWVRRSASAGRGAILEAPRAPRPRGRTGTGAPPRARGAGAPARLGPRRHRRAATAGIPRWGSGSCPGATPGRPPRGAAARDRPGPRPPGTGRSNAPPRAGAPRSRSRGADRRSPTPPSSKTPRASGARSASSRVCRAAARDTAGSPTAKASASMAASSRSSSEGEASMKPSVSRATMRPSRRATRHAALAPGRAHDPAAAAAVSVGQHDQERAGWGLFAHRDRAGGGSRIIPWTCRARRSRIPASHGQQSMPRP